MNNLSIIGHVGQDPVLRYLDSGSVVCNFSLGVKNPFNKENPTDWFDCEFWGKQAETAAEWIKKGKQVGVIGSVHLEKWENQNGGGAKLKVKGNSFELLGKKDEG